MEGIEGIREDDMADEQRTRFALAAVDFANLFNEVFQSVKLAGYGVELTAPEGISTGGGVQSMQHITLNPAGGGMSLVVGSCDKVGKRAELRSYEQVAQVYSQRSGGEALPLVRQDYDHLLGRLRDFLKSQDFRVEMAPLARAAQPAAGSSSASPLLWVVIVVLLLAAGAAAWYFLR